MLNEFELKRMDLKVPYTCAYCKNRVAGIVLNVFQSYPGTVVWLQCPHCHEGSVKSSSGVVFPISMAGDDVGHLPDAVKDVYEEARYCLTFRAFTAVELMCRKILMYVAADKGANQGKAFAYYVEHLQTIGYITAPMAGWVDQIRRNANEATHELPSVTEERATNTLYFVTALLRNVYENPGRYAISQPDEP